jgi:1,2-diacylglycerol 3-beta-galactosyltransferase
LHVPAKIFGFVHNMPELMHAADVIVTKAGPGTICEALACRLPIILSGYVPGQEEGNVDYVVNNNVGVLAHNPIELVDALRLLLKPGSQELRRQLEHAKRLSKPYASFDIAHCILGALPPRESPSVWQSPQWQCQQQKMSGRLRSAIRIRRFRRRLPRPLLNSPLMRRLSHLGIQRLSSRITASKDQKR